MNSKITFFYKTPLHVADNYIIEDIDEYLKKFQNHTEDKVQFKPFQTVQTIRIPTSENLIEYNKFYNYAKIESSDNYPASYWFVTNIEWSAAGVAVYTLNIDLLNTFGNDLEFTNKTIIKREMVDRWDYSPGIYVNENDVLYLKKNFNYYFDQPETKTKIAEYYLYPDNLKNTVINNNIWVRIVLKDPLKGFKSVYLNYYYDFKIINQQGQTITVKSVLNIDPVKEFDFLSVLLQNKEDILSINIVPYPPIDILKNTGVEDAPAVHYLNLKPFLLESFKIEIDDPFQKGQKIEFVFFAISLPFLLQFIPANSLALTIKKAVYDNSAIYSINTLLANLLIQKVNNGRSIINRLKNELFLNGVFSENRKEFRDYSDFWDVNEPAVLGFPYLNLKFSFRGFDNVVFLENFIFKNNNKFIEFCDSLQNHEYDSNIISISWRNYWIKNGANYYVNPGFYFNYRDKDVYPINFNFQIPLISNSYLDFERNLEAREMEKNIEEQKQKEIERKIKEGQHVTFGARAANMVGDAWNWFTGKASKAMDYINENIIDTNALLYRVEKSGALGKAGGTILRSLVRGRGIKRAILTGAISAAGGLFFQDEKDNKVALNNTNFEEALSSKELKLSLIIEMCPKTETLQNKFYFLGYPVNRSGIPLHNNRKYFDYLEAEIDIKNNIAINNEMREDLHDLFRSGVYYIHKTALGWHFPTDNVENIENELLKKI